MTYSIKKLLYLISIFLAPAISVNAQNLFFIGNRSYPSTEKKELFASSSGNKSLDVVIAKNGQSGLIALTTESMLGTLIRGKAYLYLDDGQVITLVDRGLYDLENHLAPTVYYLTSQEIDMISQSNINTIRFSVKCKNCVYATDEGNYSVVNSAHPVFGRAEFSELVTELYNR